MKLKCTTKAIWENSVDYTNYKMSIIVTAKLMMTTRQSEEDNLNSQVCSGVTHKRHFGLDKVLQSDDKQLEHNNVERFNNSHNFQQN